MLRLCFRIYTYYTPTHVELAIPYIFISIYTINLECLRPSTTYESFLYRNLGHTFPRRVV